MSVDILHVSTTGCDLTIPSTMSLTPFPPSHSSPTQPPSLCLSPTHPPTHPHTHTYILPPTRTHSHPRTHTHTHTHTYILPHHQAHSLPLPVGIQAPIHTHTHILSFSLSPPSLSSSHPSSLTATTL